MLPPAEEKVFAPLLNLPDKGKFFSSSVTSGEFMFIRYCSFAKIM
jgi:hypothetical protein